MSRSGYIDDYDDQWSLIRWRGAVKSALKGKRGQAFLRELVAALDALPEKRLVANSLQAPSGEFCALGAVGHMRGINLDELDPDDMERVSAVFGISDAMAREIVYINYESLWRDHSPEARYAAVREWAQRWIIEAAHDAVQGDMRP